MDTALWQEISAVLGGSADPSAGSLAHLTALWDRCPEGEAALRCVIAHYAADLEPELADELAWDERALASWLDSDATDWEAIGIPDPMAMLPSLHLNLGDDLLRAGDRDAALGHLAAAEEHLDALADDGYGQMIRRGVAGLAARCEASVLPTAGPGE